MPEQPALPKGARGRLGRWLRRLGGCLAALLAAEALWRALSAAGVLDQARLARAREFVQTGGASWYEPRPYYGWAVAKGLRGENPWGFNGPDIPLERRPGVPRILCLGGSTTAGGNDLGHLGSYPHFLKLCLEADLGHEVEVLNGGISGWTSAEMLCAWFLFFQDYRPDWIVIHEVANDVEARMTPGFRRDYVHWRSVWRLEPAGAWLTWLVSQSDLCAWLFVQKGAPALREATTLPRTGPWAFDGQRLPIETLAPLERNYRSIAASAALAGGRVLFVTLPVEPPRADRRGFEIHRVGIAEHNQLLRRLAQDSGGPHVDLEQAAQAVDSAELATWFLDLVHVVPAANRWKAERIAAVLLPELQRLTR
jgi:hypothetical protein